MACARILLYKSSRNYVTFLSEYCSDPFAILYHSFSFIYSPFYMTHSHWAVRHFTWLIMIDLLANYVTHPPWSLRHSMWLILIDLLPILRDSLSSICSPFYMTDSRWSIRQFTWLIMVDLFAIICDSFLICSPFYGTLSRWSVLHSTWLIMVDIFAIYVSHSPCFVRHLHSCFSLLCFILWYVRHSCDSFSSICSPFTWLFFLDLFAIHVTHALDLFAIYITVSLWYVSYLDMFAILVTRSPWSVRHLHDCFSLVCSPFMWIMRLDMFAILRDSFLSIYSPFYITPIPWHLLTANLIILAALVT